MIHHPLNLNLRIKKLMKLHLFLGIFLRGFQNLNITSNHIKHPREQEKVGLRKKSKASKVSLDPITLTEGDLHDIGDAVQDVTTEALQQFEQQQKLLLGAI